MRIVLDTNVIISAALSSGSPPDAILQQVKQRSIEAVTSTPLMEELENVLRRPYIQRRISWPEVRIAIFVQEYADVAALIRLDERVRIEAIVADPSDNRVLETAVAGEADYIVSGDDHLLSLGSYEGIEIVSPARFVTIVATVSDS